MGAPNIAPKKGDSGTYMDIWSQNKISGIQLFSWKVHVVPKETFYASIPISSMLKLRFNFDWQPFFAHIHFSTSRAWNHDLKFPTGPLFLLVDRPMMLFKMGKLFELSTAEFTGVPSLVLMHVRDMTNESVTEGKALSTQMTNLCLLLFVHALYMFVEVPSFFKCFVAFRASERLIRR